MTAILAVLGAAIAAPAWWRRSPTDRLSWLLPVIGAVVVAGAGGLAALGRLPDDAGLTPVGAVVAVLVAVVVGGPLTAAALAVGQPPRRPDPSGTTTLRPRAPDQVLRGGAWIGSLERAAVCVTVLAGWPEGIAAVLAVKGLGRYPELRDAGATGATERFIIGTGVSVLWACAAAGTAWLL